MLCTRKGKKKTWKLEEKIERIFFNTYWKQTALAWKIVYFFRKSKLSYLNKKVSFLIFGRNKSWVHYILNLAEISLSVSQKGIGEDHSKQWWFYLFLLSGKGDNTIPESEIMFLRLRFPFIAPRIVLCTQWVLVLLWFKKKCKLINFVLIFKAGLSIKLFFKTLEKLKDLFYIMTGVKILLIMNSSCIY